MAGAALQPHDFSCFWDDRNKIKYRAFLFFLPGFRGGRASNLVFGFIFLCHRTQLILHAFWVVLEWPPRGVQYCRGSRLCATAAGGPARRLQLWAMCLAGERGREPGPTNGRARTCVFMATGSIQHPRASHIYIVAQRNARSSCPCPQRGARAGTSARRGRSQTKHSPNICVAHGAAMFGGQMRP